MEQEPERLPERQAPPRPPTTHDLARLAESRRALDRRSERTPPGGRPVDPAQQRPGPPPGEARPMRSVVLPPAPPSGSRLPVPVRQPPPPPMSDMTTTMPILVVPDEDPDVRSAPPGEPGHFHTDTDSGRHRGGGRAPRGLIAVFGVAAVIGVGLVATGAFDGGSAKTPSGAQAGSPAGAQLPNPGGSPTGTPGPSSDSPSDSAAPDPSASSPSGTPTRTRRTPSPRPSTSKVPTPTGSGNSTLTASPGRSTPPSASPSSPPSSPGTPPQTPPPFPALSKGATGQAVSDMQHMLDQDGYMPWYYRDGRFDQTTLDAVNQFQADHAGTASADGPGVYGAATNAALRKDLGLGP